MEELSEKLIQTIGRLEELAPSVWGIARRQVYGDIISNAIGLTVLLVAALICAYYMRKTWLARKMIIANWKEDDNFYSRPDTEMYVFGTVALGVVSVLAGVLAISCFTSAVVRFYNPDWYAIQLLIGQFK